MALIALQQAALAGTAITFAAATGGGDTVVPRDHGVLLVKNGDATSKTVTIVTPGSTKFGQAEPDVAVVVAAGAQTAIGPLNSQLASEGVVAITYSAVTSVTVAHVTL